MPTGTASPYVKPQWFTNGGVVAAGYKLFIYLAGTTTKTNTYSDVNLGSANTNPIILDSAGRATIFLVPATSYKFVLAPPTDTDPPTSPVWTVDGVKSVPTSNVDVDIDGIAGENIAANDAVYLSQGLGSKTAGRWYRTDSAQSWSSRFAVVTGVAVNSIAAAATGTIRIAGRVTGFTGLSSGTVYAADVTPGALTLAITSQAWIRNIAIADSANSVVVLPLHPQDPPLTLNAAQGDITNAGAAETAIFSHGIPAGLVYSFGASVRLLVWGSCANNANAKRIRVYVIDGGTSNLVLDAALTINEASQWLLGMSVQRGSLVNSSSACAQISSGPATGPVSASVTGVAYCTMSWANSIELRVTATAIANNDVIRNGGMVTFLPPAFVPT